MKTVASLSGLLVAAIFAVGCAPSEQANGEETADQASELSARNDAQCTVFNRTACLINSARSSRKIDISYPGMQWCKVSFVGSGLGQVESDLINDLEFTLPSNQTGQPVVVPATMTDDGITVDLGSDMLYMTTLTVRTKNGQSLDKVIRAKLTNPALPGGPATLVGIPTRCPQQK